MKLNGEKATDDNLSSLFVREHSYSKKKRVYTKSDLSYREVHLFNECEYSVCAVWNSNPQQYHHQQQQPIHPRVPQNVPYFSASVDTYDTGFHYEGFVNFKKCYYTEAYRIMSGFNVKSLSVDSSEPNMKHFSQLDVEVYERALSIVNRFFVGADVINQEKNTIEYRMRRHRLTAELYAYELSNLYMTISCHGAQKIKWLNEVLLKYLSDFQLFCFIELLTIVLSNFPVLASCFSFVTRSFSSPYSIKRKLLGLTLQELYNKILTCWIPFVIPQAQSTKEDTSTAPKETPKETPNDTNLAALEAPTENGSRSPDFAVLIIPPLPCSVLSDSEDDFDQQDLFWTNRMNVFEKYFKNVEVLYYKMKPLNQRDFTDEMISWWLNDLGCVIQRRISQFRKTDPSTPIFLIGWLTGASLAYKIFTGCADQLNGIVLVNMPTNNGTVGFEKNMETRPFIKVTTPIIFVNSSESVLCNANELQEIRSTMSHPTFLIYVHHCDDLMLMKSNCKKRFCVPQDVIDIVVVDTIKNQIINHIANANSVSIKTASKKHATKLNESTNTSGPRKTNPDDRGDSASHKVVGKKSGIVPNKPPVTAPHDLPQPLPINTSCPSVIVPPAASLMVENGPLLSFPQNTSVNKPPSPKSSINNLMPTAPCATNDAGEAPVHLRQTELHCHKRGNIQSNKQSSNESSDHPPPTT